jgi:hypothetical protein
MGLIPTEAINRSVEKPLTFRAVEISRAESSDLWIYHGARNDSAPGDRIPLQ